MKYDSLEIARIIGAPFDPRRPYPLLVEKLCETDTADPNEYVYQYDALLETDKVLISAGSTVTQENVTPDTPALITFTDVMSPEYYVKLTDLASAKEKTLARKKKTINRAMNAEENRMVIQLLNAAAIASGNLNDLRSGETSVNYQHIIDMVDEIIDYSENYVFVVGSQIDKDLKLMDWKDSDKESLMPAMTSSKFPYIGETPRSELVTVEDNTEATHENGESVTTTRETSNEKLDDDIVCSVRQRTEATRNE